MRPPASHVLTDSPSDGEPSQYQFTILTDWGNLSVEENFAEGKEGIERKTNVQPLGIAPAERR
jgi:hypothetical protein